MILTPFISERFTTKFIALFVIFAFSIGFFNREAICSEKKEDQKVTFNFVDVELPAITKFISDISGKNFIFDERLKGKITIIAPTKLSITEAYNLFVSVLELKGFTVIPSGVNAYKIVPINEAKQKGMQVVIDRTPVNETYLARIVQLKHISSEEAMRFLQPLLSRDGHLSAFGPANLLLIVDSGLNIEKMLSILEVIDQPSVRDEPEVVYLKNASAEAVVKVLNDGIIRRPRAGQPTATEEAKAVADTRLNAVILFGDKAQRESMKNLISKIDMPSQEKAGKLNVYFLEHADATELAKVLDSIVKSAVSQRQPPASGAPVAAFESQLSINIAADKSTNALIITASPSDYQSLVGIIKQLDKRRRQVFVEATIIEASLEKLSDIGARWRAVAKSGGNPVTIGGFGTIDASAINSIITGLKGFTMGGMGNFMDIKVTKPDGTVSNITAPGIAALFSLDEFKSAVNVLSTPQILTSDNKEAEIVVGKNVPFISRREADPTRTLSVFSTIERKDVGITLKITPQITEGDYVKLDIYQEISSVIAEPESVVISVGPTTTKRATRTSVVAKDAKTIVISGLMQERQDEQTRGIPVLSNIPLLGWLFKNKTVNTEKTNLLVFITPHIVKDSDKMEEITSEKTDAFSNPLSRYVQDELIVLFHPEVTEDRVGELVKNTGGTIVKKFKGSNSYLIKIPHQSSLDAMKRHFLRLSEVITAEPNYIKGIR